MKDNQIVWIVGIGIVLYYIYKYNKSNRPGTYNYTPTPTDDEAMAGLQNQHKNSGKFFGTSPNEICIEPSFAFKNTFNGRSCAGSFVDETKVLKLGDTGCDVLLLQQRLNAIQNEKNILKPTGHFNCETLAKLKDVRGYSEMRLDMFQPDEEIGFNSLDPTRQRNFNYKYMDIDNMSVKPNKY